MSLYICILIITFIFINFSKCISASKSDLNLLEKGLELISPCAIGLQFYVVINNTSNKDYDVELSAEQCCLISDQNTDCDTLEIIGNCNENIPRGTKNRLKLIAPVLDPFERRGFCVINFVSKLSNTYKNNIKRDTLKINFDTRVDNKKQFMDLPANIKTCKSIDQNPLNYCNPVECDSYYNGRKPYFSERLKRCQKIPSCVSNFVSELPSAIYDPVSNVCIDGKSILEDDIEFIKSLERPSDSNQLELHDVLLPSFNKSDIDYLTGNNSNNSYLYNNREPTHKMKISQITGNYYSIFRSYVIYNKCTIIVLITVVLIQCCLICVLVYYVTNKCGCFRKKNKLFSYNKDTSLTTPLICSTDTETTDYRYSESSNNIGKKIKCYKSCQKERNKDVKISMSDDILSKCITRRDWIDNKYLKSEVIPENNHNNNKKDTKTGVTEFNKNKSSMKEIDQHVVPIRRLSEAKVVFEDERSPKCHNNKQKDQIIKNIIHKVDYNRNKIHQKHEKKDSDSSEKEIRCHSYECLNTNNTNNKQTNNNHKFHQLVNEKKGTISLSTEKGAQASFSNDSIDDFLSERGMIFLEGDDISKYSFSCNSIHTKASVTSEGSSKTSKDNIVKNMLSTLLNRRSKQGMSSDPGIAANEDIDVELIHMSHASEFISSNDSECIKAIRKRGNSRSSL